MFTSKAERRAAAAKRRRSGRPLMVSESEWAEAQEWKPSQEELLEWWTKQRVELKHQLKMLEESWEESFNGISEEWTPQEWARHWRRQARLVVQTDRLWKLETESHILVCRNHGVDGVDDWDQSNNRAAGLRGHVLKDESQWESYCIRCQESAQVETLTRQLAKRWQDRSDS